jgi:hypothetical protein
MIEGNIMANQKFLSFSIIAASAVTGFYLSSVPASAAKVCGTKAECACLVALDTGSRSALRKFLQLYPRSDTACNALASTATVKDKAGEENSNFTTTSGSLTPTSGGGEEDEDEDDDDDDGDDGDGDGDEEGGGGSSEQRNS